MNVKRLTTGSYLRVERRRRVCSIACYRSAWLISDGVMNAAEGSAHPDRPRVQHPRGDEGMMNYTADYFFYKHAHGNAHDED